MTETETETGTTETGTTGTGTTGTGRPPRVLLGYDASRSAAAALEVAALLLPGAAATVLHLWNPPFASPELRQRLTRRARDVDHLIGMVEREGRTEAARVAAEGATLARAAGWSAEEKVSRCYGGDGYQLARTAGELSVDLVVVGARGLSGVRAVLDSTSDVVVHVSPVPVLVVPSALLREERAAVTSGPVLIATDLSPLSALVTRTAADLFPHRRRREVTVEPAGGDGEPDESGSGGESEVETVHLPRPGRRDDARAVAAAIGAYASQQSAALVVVGSRGRSAHRELLLGSVAMAVLHHVHRPVLVVPPPRERGGP